MADYFRLLRKIWQKNLFLLPHLSIFRPQIGRGGKSLEIFLILSFLFWLFLSSMNYSQNWQYRETLSSRARPFDRILLFCGGFLLFKNFPPLFSRSIYFIRLFFTIDWTTPPQLHCPDFFLWVSQKQWSHQQSSFFFTSFFLFWPAHVKWHFPHGFGPSLTSRSIRQTAVPPFFFGSPFYRTHHVIKTLGPVIRLALDSCVNVSSTQ
jgi:hypothetical protein